MNELGFKIIDRYNGLVGAAAEAAASAAGALRNVHTSTYDFYAPMYRPPLRHSLLLVSANMSADSFYNYS